MRTDTEIDEIALPVEADFLPFRDLGDVFGLVALADLAEEGDGRITVPNLTSDLLVASHDVAHLRLDPAEIFRCKRLGAGEIVIKAVIGRRSEGDLSVGVELLDRLGHHMSRIVAQDFEPILRVARNDFDRGITVDQIREIARPAIDPNGDCRLRETRPDRRRDFGAGNGTREFAALAVRQGDDDWRRTDGRSTRRRRLRNVRNVISAHDRSRPAVLAPRDARHTVP